MDRQLLPSLTVFVEVADSLSFSQATIRLSVNASSISRTIARLEDHLNVKVLRRTSNESSIRVKTFIDFVKDVLRLE